MLNIYIYKQKPGSNTGVYTKNKTNNGVQI